MRGHAVVADRVVDDLLCWQDITHGSPDWAVHRRGGDAEGSEGWVVRQVLTETSQYHLDAYLSHLSGRGGSAAVSDCP